MTVASAPGRVVTALMIACGLAAGCEGVYDVVEDPGPTQAQQPPETPTPTPWLTGHLTVVPEALDFGPVSLTCRSVQEVRVHNDGLEPVRIFGISTSIGSTSEFAVDDHVGTLESFDTLLVPVAYRPIDVGVDGASLLIQSDDPHQEVHSVSLTGRDSRAGERVETFFQPPGVPADFIWLLDTSGSMSDDIDKVIANFDRFMDELAGLDIDYQMALLTTNLDDEGKFQGTYGAEGLPWVTTAMGSEGLDAFLQQMYTVSRQLKQTDERGLDALNLALSDENLTTVHAGFVREEARLVTTVFSDENDHSIMTPANIAQRLRAVKPSGEIVFSAIVGLGDPEGSCHDEEGDRYIQLAYEFDGYVDDVCASSYDDLMATLGSYGSAAESIFPLAGDPELAYGFVVEVEGAEIEPAPADTSSPRVGWVYDAAENAIVFGVESVPAAGARIDVTYVEIATCE